MTNREQEIFWIIWEHGPIATASISDKLGAKVSVPTLNRDLAKLKNGNFIIPEGKGPALRYRANPKGMLLAEIDPNQYFTKEADARRILTHFNREIFTDLVEMKIFSKAELEEFESLTSTYREKVALASPALQKREFERLMIELSWKSSQIEGNTYSLLETEQLLKYNIASPKHSSEETKMVLNHKAAIEYIRENKNLYEQVRLAHILDIHALLTQGMGISKNIRKRGVRITGTNYVPPENEFVIEESLGRFCDLLNAKTNPMEKAFLAVILISYIQPFEDGNKRTARLLANGILMASHYCPLSYRSVDPGDYKKNMLLFYELNSFTAFKAVFSAQYKFAVAQYF